MNIFQHGKQDMLKFAKFHLFQKSFFGIYFERRIYHITSTRVRSTPKAKYIYTSQNMKREGGVIIVL